MPQLCADVFLLCHDTSGILEPSQGVHKGPVRSAQKRERCSKEFCIIDEAQPAVQVPIGGKLVDLAPRKLASPYLTAIFVYIESLP